MIPCGDGSIAETLPVERQRFVAAANASAKPRTGGRYTSRFATQLANVGRVAAL